MNWALNPFHGYEIFRRVGDSTNWRVAYLPGEMYSSEARLLPAAIPRGKASELSITSHIDNHNNPSIHQQTHETLQ